MYERRCMSVLAPISMNISRQASQKFSNLTKVIREISDIICIKFWLLLVRNWALIAYKYQLSCLGLHFLSFKFIEFCGGGYLSPFENIFSVYNKTALTKIRKLAEIFFYYIIFLDIFWPPLDKRIFQDLI